MDISFDDRKKCADRLRKFRESQGWTQEQFAEKMGMSPQGYKMVERGTNNVSVSFLRKLHDRIGISSDYILYGESGDMEMLWDSVKQCEDSDKMEMLLRQIT